MRQMCFRQRPPRARNAYAPTPIRVEWLDFFKEFPLHHIRHALAAALLATLTATALATTPAPPATPAAPAAPATPAATDAASPTAAQSAAKQALSDFFHAMFKGDQKTAFSLLTYSDLDDKKMPKSKATAELMFGEVLAEQRLRIAVLEAFGESAKGFTIGKSAEYIADFEKELGAAIVTMDEKTNNAYVRMGAGPTFIVVLKDGKWLVDFDKSQTNIGPLPPGSEMNILSMQLTGYDQLAKDVAAKKFGSMDELTRALDKIHDTIDDTLKTQPATATAPAL
jgi:hypothetical protein